MARQLKFADRASVALLSALLCLVGCFVPNASAISCIDDPYGTGDDGWQMGRDVEYDVTGLPSGTVRERAVAALAAWDNKSCLNVNFQPDTATTITDLTFYSGDDPNKPGTLPASTTWSTGFDYLVDSAWTYIAHADPAFYNPTLTTFPSAIQKAAMHEVGHTMSLNEGLHYGSYGSWVRVSVMNRMWGINDVNRNMPDGLTSCDYNRLSLNVQCLDLAGDDPPPNGTCGWQQGINCPAGWSFAPAPPGQQPVGYVYCCYYTPIVVDVAGDGFDLTSAPGGVLFDIRPGDLMEQVAWTAVETDDAWLALDRNGNGAIDDGAELFGNFTPQPPTAVPHGFVALAEHDKPEHGGNGDGSIDAADAVFDALRLWQDTNHNGVSESVELKTLPELNIARFHLDFRESRQVDEYGNAFRYRAKVYDTGGHQAGRWAWDVQLQVAP